MLWICVGPWQSYHLPMALDIPVDIRVTMLEDAPNPVGVQSSKG